MTTLLAWLVVMELSFVASAVLVASLQMKRRTHFWLRFTLSLVGLLAGLALLAAAVLLKVLPESLLMPLWLALAVGALILTLLFCYRTAAILRRAHPRVAMASRARKAGPAGRWVAVCSQMRIRPPHGSATTAGQS